MILLISTLEINQSGIWRYVSIHSTICYLFKNYILSSVCYIITTITSIYFTQIHPEGKVPALVDTDDKVIVDSLVIANHLDEKYAQPPLYHEKTKDRDLELLDHYSKVRKFNVQSFLFANGVNKIIIICSNNDLSSSLSVLFQTVFMVMIADHSVKLLLKFHLYQQNLKKSSRLVELYILEVYKLFSDFRSKQYRTKKY